MTIAGAAFAHRLYQFALAHSGWRHAQVVEGGESFDALSSRLQSALWHLGGSPDEHRTDSLSAAFRNLNVDEKDDLIKRYESLCAHYAMRATCCNPGESHENGSIEARNGSLKSSIRQALLLRGSSDFIDVSAYAEFVTTIVNRMNARVESRAAAERVSLRPLPQRRTAEFTEFSARVSKFGIFTIKGAMYSAPTRLVGHRLLVRQYADRVECWLGGTRVHEAPLAICRDGRHPRYFARGRITNDADIAMQVVVCEVAVNVVDNGPPSENAFAITTLRLVGIALTLDYADGYAGEAYQEEAWEAYERLHAEGVL